MMRIKQEEEDIYIVAKQFLCRSFFLCSNDDE
jgi:hypothetical protein